MNIVYLASPYSHESAEVMQRRFESVVRAAGVLMQSGLIVFCPIAHSHHIGLHIGREVAHDFWMQQDLPLLACSSKLIVYALPEWSKSRGIAQEVSVARKLNMPIEYITEDYIRLLDAENKGRA